MANIKTLALLEIIYEPFLKAVEEEKKNPKPFHELSPMGQMIEGATRRYEGKLKKLGLGHNHTKN